MPVETVVLPPGNIFEQVVTGPFDPAVTLAAMEEFWSRTDLPDGPIHLLWNAVAVDFSSVNIEQTGIMVQGVGLLAGRMREGRSAVLLPGGFERHALGLYANMRETAEVRQFSIFLAREEALTFLREPD